MCHLWNWRRMYEHVYICVCVAGTHLTVAIFNPQSTEEVWLKLMCRTIFMDANNLGITSICFNNHKKLCVGLPATSECQAPSQIKLYESAARRKPWIFPGNRWFFPPFHQRVEQPFLSKTHQHHAGWSSALHLPSKGRNCHQKWFWQSSMLQLLAMGCYAGYGKVCWYNSSKQIHNLWQAWLNFDDISVWWMVYRSSLFPHLSSCNMMKY